MAGDVKPMARLDETGVAPGPEDEYLYNRHDGKEALVVRLETAVRGVYQTSFGTPGASAAARTNVAQNAADVQLLTASATRTALTIYNDSTDDLYIAYGTAAASLTSFTTVLGPRQTWSELTTFQGEVRGIWSAAGAGNARVTEETE